MARSSEAIAEALRAGPPHAAETIAAWWDACSSRLLEADSPFASAVRGGVLADRLGYAFAAGYEAALSALLPARDRTKIAALCASEKGGAHPRAIATTIEDGALRGEKTFVTLADRAEDLLVLASRGTDARGRAELVLARVDRAAEGVTLTPLGATPFVPEIPHASVRFEGVRAFAILPGDGWTDYVRPFRTVEDVHVHAALLAYLIATGRRAGWPRDALLRGAALLASLASIAQSDPSSPATHLALAGAIDLSRALVAELEPAWDGAPDEERTRWRRDRVLMDVAGKARAQRLERAWEALEEYASP